MKRRSYQNNLKRLPRIGDIVKVVQPDSSFHGAIGKVYAIRELWFDKTMLNIITQNMDDGSFLNTFVSKDYPTEILRLLRNNK